MLRSTNEVIQKTQKHSFSSIAKNLLFHNECGMPSIDLWNVLATILIQDIYSNPCYLLPFWFASALKRHKKEEKKGILKNKIRDNNKVLRVQACFVVAPYRMTFIRTINCGVYNLDFLFIHVIEELFPYTNTAPMQSWTQQQQQILFTFALLSYIEHCTGVFVGIHRCIISMSCASIYVT